MEFIQDLLNNVKSVVAPKAKQRTWDFDNEVALTHHVVETPPSPPQLLYESDEQANRTFLTKYWLFMTNHYGRPPAFRTDLFCCMIPMDVLDPELDPEFPIRYWWMSLKHPLVHILQNNGADPEQHLDSVVFGIGLVYRDEYIEQVVDWLVELNEQDETRPKLNLDAKSAFAKDRDRLRPMIEEEEEKPEDFPPPPPPSLILNGTNSFATSKKDD